ncbi:DinB family protein [Algoriphagus lacus]|uniref:DinB family protein n=1 Tax=Algoriphagus lacus TaxID=2056311 RepID=A0A418PS95_9BACT|nr:DinB family protein [Algoriphagus lacus]RIW15749.1 DinB family protein [Algoriphagus lacus]
MNTFSLPKKGEYPGYYDTYLSKIPDENFSVLALQQIEELKNLFQSKEPGWDSRPYAAGKWTPKEVLGHMIDTERIMTFRALCFARGESKALPGFDQDPYVLNARFGQVPVENLLADFEAQRKALLTLITTLSESVLDNVGNANGNPITPRALFWIIPGHFIHHFSILKERY